MKVVLSNKSKVGLGKVVVDTNNKIAKVNFTKAPVAGPLGLQDLNNVNISNQKVGDVLVFNGTNYVIETIPDIDGGIF